MIFRQCAAVEKDICWASVSGDETDGDTWTLVSDAGEAFAGVELAIERLTTRFETDDVLLCLSEGRNFRYDVDERPTRRTVRERASRLATLKWCVGRARRGRTSAMTAWRLTTCWASSRLVILWAPS